jgi:hypothetical protein
MPAGWRVGCFPGSTIGNLDSEEAEGSSRRSCVSLHRLACPKQHGHDRGDLAARVVLPVGGIEEKVVAAAAAGLTRVMPPARKRRDDDDTPRRPD